jgi:hypothetical protein
MSQQPPNKTFAVAIIGAAAIIIAAIIGLGAPFAERLADIYFPKPTSNDVPVQPTQVSQTTQNQVPQISSSLLVNGITYQIPTHTSTPFCVAPELNTGMNNINEYDIVVPDGWVMMWDSWKAEWNGGSYDSDGLLIIVGPYSGRIKINTGGSCSGPIEWYDFILDNRRNAYPVPSRIEYIIP